MPARSKGRKFCSYPPAIKSKVSQTPKFTLSAPRQGQSICRRPLYHLWHLWRAHGNGPNHQPAIMGDWPHNMPWQVCYSSLTGRKSWKITRLNSQMAGRDQYLKDPQNSSVQQLQLSISPQPQQPRNNWRRNLDSKPIWGEYTVWIFRNYFRQWHQIHPEHCHEVY